MAVAFDDVKPRLDQLRDFVLKDLDRITRERIGGNYAAVAVIGCACEALGFLRCEKRDGSDFFTEYLLPEAWREVGPDIYDALRNGVAHGYDTKKIRLPEREVEVGVSWRDKSHLTFDESQNTIYVNVQELAAALSNAFARYERELVDCAALRDDFHTRWKKGRCLDVVSEDRRSAWRRLIEQ